MKYYFKKNIIPIIISIGIILFSLLLCIAINDNSLDESDLKIKEYKVNLKINKDGSANFDNYVTFDFSNTYYEDSYRVIYIDISDKKGNMLSYGDIDGNEVVYLENKDEDQARFDESSFETVVTQNGKEIELTQIGYSFNNDIEMDTKERVKARNKDEERIFCYYEEGYTVDTTFNYKYKIDGFVSKYQDIGLINWILSPETDIPTENLSFNISFEEELNDYDIDHLKNNFYVHGNIPISGEVNIDKNGISFKVDEQKAYQCVEIRAGFNNHLVSNTHDNNTYDFKVQEHLDKVEELTYYELSAYTERYYLIQKVLLIILPITFIYVVLIWIYAYKKYDKERVSSFDYEYYRELPASYPPAELGYLCNFKETTKDDLSATIMDLIRRGFISLDTNGFTSLDKKPNYMYIYNKGKDESELKSYEKFVLTWYFERIAKDNKLTLNDIDEYLKKEENAEQYLRDNKEFIRLVRVESRKNNFFDNFKELSVKLCFVFIPLIVLIIASLYIQVQMYYTYSLVFTAVFIGLVIVLYSYIANIKRRSETGNEDYVRWMAFKNFLLNFGKFEDYTMPLIEIWEHYLVYAVSFGIADKVEEQMRLKFKSLGEDKYNEYVTSSNIYHSRTYIYVSRSCHNSTSIAQSTISQAQAARAGKSGGSFGGGRSFGGGGGGFSAR